MRIAGLTLLLLTAFATPAWATAQEPELLLLNGRVLPLYSTPLDPLLGSREDLDEVFTSWSTGNWRGYVGTWHIEGQQLLLVRLVRKVYHPELERGGRKGVFVETEVPLSTLFADDEGPVAATWFSGMIRIPQGLVERYVHMGFGTTYDVELHLEIVRGLVVSRRVVDTLHEHRGRCRADITWTSLPSAYSHPPRTSDPSSWVDARTIGTSTFREAVAPGRPFLTRGLLDREGESDTAYLWIPATPATPGVRYPLASAPGWPGDSTWPHVEAEATWVAKPTGMSLSLRWFRLLKPGETIHHPTYPVPALPVKTLADRRDGLDPDEFATARSREDVEDCFRSDHGIAAYGTLVDDNLATVLGVDVATDPALIGKPVVVVGLLEKWIITKRLLEIGHADVEPFKSRGPGTYYRLVDPYTGRLAQPKLDDEAEEDQGEEQD